MNLLIAVLSGFVLWGAIRYIAFRRKNAQARWVRELVINERTRRRRRDGAAKMAFLKIKEVWCERVLDAFLPNGTHQGCLTADVYDGSYLVVRAFYRPGETDRPYDLTITLIEAGGRLRNLHWRAPEGKSLSLYWRSTPFFINEGLLVLDDLDGFAQELGRNSLKPPKSRV